MTTLVPPPASAETDGGAVTIASRLRDRAAAMPDRVAMRHKHLGIWREITWRDYWETAVLAAHGLLALGVELGDRVSVHSEDRPEWLIIDQATVAVRAITVGLYPTNPSAEVEYLLSDSMPKIHLVEDQEQADKVMEVIDSLPHLERIIHLERRGFRSFRDDPRFLHWDDLLDLGRRHLADHPEVLDRVMGQARDDDVTTLVYTSGTTGPPKGAMLSNANASFSISVIVKGGALGGRVPPTERDMLLTYLPLSHIAERVVSTWANVGTGVVLNFAESIDTVQHDLREVQPTLFFAVPRIWEKIHAAILIKGRDASLFKRLWFRSGLAAARVIGRKRVVNGGTHTVGSRLLYALFSPLVLRALRQRIGLRRCRWAGSGAAPIAPEVIEFFHGIGVGIYEIYGMTENSAVTTFNRVGRMRLGTVGEPPEGTEVRLDPDTGEIQTRHPAVFLGYWNRPEDTAAVFTDDGFLRTGDVGEWVDGTHLRIIDRMKDIIITAGGKNVSPSEIENSLKTSPFVKEAMVAGDGRKYLTALIGIELDTVGDWATRKGIPYTTFRDLSEKPEVVDLIGRVVEETNAKLARVEHIRKFRLIPKQLDHEEGELTATQKIKRAEMSRRFEDLVESMYAE